MNTTALNVCHSSLFLCAFVLILCKVCMSILFALYRKCVSVMTKYIIGYFQLSFV